jgi:hypothetical protein
MHQCRVGAAHATAEATVARREERSRQGGRHHHEPPRTPETFAPCPHHAGDTWASRRSRQGWWQSVASIALGTNPSLDLPDRILGKSSFLRRRCLECPKGLRHAGIAHGAQAPQCVIPDEVVRVIEQREEGIDRSSGGPAAQSDRDIHSRPAAPGSRRTRKAFGRPFIVDVAKARQDPAVLIEFGIGKDLEELGWLPRGDGRGCRAEPVNDVLRMHTVPVTATEDRGSEKKQAIAATCSPRRKVRLRAMLHDGVQQLARVPH